MLMRGLRRRGVECALLAPPGPLLERARALMSDPTLVMLDEPMAGVNPALTESLLDHILDLKDLGMTVLFVEHDMDMVHDISDWVIVMAEGRVIAEGTPDDIATNPDVIDAYLGVHQGQSLLEDELRAKSRRAGSVRPRQPSRAPATPPRPMPRSCWRRSTWWPATSPRSTSSTAAT